MKDFAAIDFETANNERTSVCSVGVVIVRDGEIVVVTFFMYGIDKWKAKRSKWRISEATLLGMAVIGGSIGAWLGMRVWHHKTMHKKFQLGIPLIIAAQIALMIWYFLT